MARKVKDINELTGQDSFSVFMLVFVADSKVSYLFADCQPATILDASSVLANLENDQFSAQTSQLIF